MHNNPVHVVFGSELETSRFYSYFIHRSLSLNGFHSHLSTGNCVADLLEEIQTLIIVSSNTKEGKPPRNIETLYYKLLRKNICLNLKKLNFAVIGLGSSNYEKHNQVGKVLHQRLSQLGANPFIGLRLFDKRNTFDFCHGFFGYIPKVIESLLDDKKAALVDTYKEPLTKVVFEKSNEVSLEQEHNTKVVENNRITAETHFRDVRKVVFENELQWQLGDTIAVKPANTDSAVSRVLARFGLDPSVSVCFEPKEPFFCKFCKHSFKKRIGHRRSFVLKDFLKYQVELQYPVSFFVMKFLANFIAEPKIKDRIYQLGSEDGTEDFFYYCVAEKKYLIEVLEEFPSCKLPFSLFLELLPPLKRREFSICSLKGKIETLIAVVTRKTPYGRIRTGLFSDAIQKQKALFLDCKIKETELSKHRNRLINEELLVVATGTGIAAAIAFIRTRNLMNKKTFVFFGTRHPLLDFFFKQDLEHSCVVLFLAFSRVVNEKVYVQQKLVEKNKVVFEFLQKDKSIVLICGRAGQMPRAVRKSIKFCVETNSSLDPEAYYTNLEKNKRIFEETWN